MRKEKEVEGRGTGEGKRQRVEGKEGGGVAAGPPVWVPYPQGLEKGKVLGNVKEGRQNWMRFSNGETHKVASILSFATEATTTARWQKATGGGGGGEQRNTPPPHTHTG